MDKVEVEKSVLNKILQRMSEIKENLDGVNKRINLLSGNSERLIEAQKIVDEKKYITKLELIEKLGLKNNWKTWQDLVLGFTGDENYNVHVGVGRASTLLVSLKNHDCGVSIASKIFINMEKKEQLHLSKLKQEYGEEEGKGIFQTIKKMFNERVILSKIPPPFLQKKY